VTQTRLQRSRFLRVAASSNVSPNTDASRESRLAPVSSTLVTTIDGMSDN